MSVFHAYSRMLLRLTIVFTIIVTAQSKGVSSRIEAQRYLLKYGYLPNSAHNLRLDEKTWSKALRDLQSFAGLRVTGKLDKETMDLMSLPRCGRQDKRTEANRSRRYVLLGGRWPTTNLTYKILSYPKSTRITRMEVDDEIDRAFQLWSNCSDLTFSKQSSGEANIEIKFAAGNHSDGFPFDSPGYVLAHAYPPLSGGSVHFDDDEDWTVDMGTGDKLFQVAVHELGHSFGLSHSDVPTAVMAPFYRGYVSNFTLDPDDIAGIQDLYGKTSSTAVDELCKDPKIDAILNLSGGERYVFKGDLFYMLNGTSMVDGYPKNISEKWKDVPGNIDGACTPRNGVTFFFKHGEYWAYDTINDRIIYQGDIKQYFGLPGHFDAVMHRDKEDKIYFFKDDIFWTYDVSRQGLKKGVLSKKGLPSNLDAAYEDEEGHAFFFKGDKFYRLDDRTDSVDVKIVPPYPRPTGQFFFGCKL